MLHRHPTVRGHVHLVYDWVGNILQGNTLGAGMILGLQDGTGIWVHVSTPIDPAWTGMLPSVGVPGLLTKGRNVSGITS